MNADFRGNEGTETEVMAFHVVFATCVGLEGRQELLWALISWPHDPNYSIQFNLKLCPEWRILELSLISALKMSDWGG